MRTNTMKLSALLLSVMLFSGLPLDRAASATDLKNLVRQGDQVTSGDRTVAAGEVVEDVVVLDGDLYVAGEVRGKAVVMGGDLILEKGGLVHGDAVVTGGEIVHRGGRVRGEMRQLEAGAAEKADAASDPITTPPTAQSVRADRSWFEAIQRGLAGIVSALALGLVLAGIGAAVVFYARPNLETVSDTVRTSMLRSGAVGIAATFLIVPAFIVLLVALIVSLIGIPLLAIAIPLYPLAVAAAFALGLLATAHALGERTAEQKRLASLRHRNSYTYLFTGLAALFAPLLTAYLVGMTGFLGFLGSLLAFVSWVGIWAAATIGLGAVILSRVGTRRTFAAPHDEPLDPEPLFDDEPAFGSPHA